MYSARQKPIFENRYDAGNQLAGKLTEYKDKSVVVLAIPNGGVPLALQVALALDADLDLVISRKIPLPLTPEAGFGAVTDDGTVILNEEVVRKTGLTEYQINYQTNKVRQEIRQRSMVYQKERSLTAITGKTIIIVDDGLASGFTMIAAVESVRRRHPREIIVAVPAASAAAFEQLSKTADKVIAVAVGTLPKFYIADFYRYWHDVSDDEVIKCLSEHRIRRFQTNIRRRPR